MALLTEETQLKLVNLLVDEGLVARSTIDEGLAEASKRSMSVVAYLTQEGIVDTELLTHATAQVSGVPYVNLANTIIDESVLNLLPADIAERFMAVPLAAVLIRLAVVLLVPFYV